MKSNSFYIFCLGLPFLFFACKKENDLSIVNASHQVCSITSLTEGMDQDTTITRFTYSDHGNLLKEEKFSFSEVLQAYTNYEYDVDKKIKEELFWTDGGSTPPYLVATTLFEYDVNENLTRMSTSGKLWCGYYLYEYDGTLLTKSSSFNCWLGANILEHYIEYEYDSLSRKAKEIHFQADGTLSYIYTFDYENGKLRRKHTFVGSETSVFEYGYDKSGNLTKEEGIRYIYDKFNRIEWVLHLGIDTVTTLRYEYCE